jgi:pyridinium-3,5-bisthiocarboxylic acid mononucleotide nickel chelatase
LRKSLRSEKMRVAYFDCFSGASGDMILGALIDAGLSARRLREELRKLHAPSIRLRINKVLKRGISATQVSVTGKDERSHRTFREMLRLVDRSGLEPEVKAKCKEIFGRIASEEGFLHGKAIEEIHFHEVGGLDSVVDIAGAVWGIRQLGVERVYVSRVNLGAGFVRCQHGILPVPSPAALALMKGKPVYSSGAEAELLTPTGAALLSTLGTEFGNLPSMTVERVGYGAGKSDLPHPNLLRLMIGSLESSGPMETVAVLETNIDDMNPQFYDYLMDKILDLGALDVYVVPVLMKKNRPATLLTVICPVDKLPAASQFLLRETTSIGVRWRVEERACAEREIIRLDTKYGPIHFKLARWRGALINLSPEYDDCKRLAMTKGVALKEVFEEARKTALMARDNKKIF